MPIVLKSSRIYLGLFAFTLVVAWRSWAGLEHPQEHEILMALLFAAVILRCIWIAVRFNFIGDRVVFGIFAFPVLLMFIRVTFPVSDATLHALRVATFAAWIIAAVTQVAAFFLFGLGAPSQPQNSVELNTPEDSA